ncbi:SOS response-associated peptidase [Sporolactobacillus sp. CPB3-1]|uniref:Abasic site processing protein n=1 Tax=Sporolactobacillus mangiferae TaxID=2940498 RepID=A0ABT0M7A5_9BACL|nr:SOS response-associated peptidase [Sporolactobacillus mangiferae]MCL1630533.1 SOS response-associated peptidase [Sporolactobacillus mangiferae]
MCGRFTLIAPYQYITARFGVRHAVSKEKYNASYNTAPGQNILAVVRGSSGNRMGYLRWGLIPSWAKDEKIGYKLINARSESVTEKPSFRESFSKRRCLIIADSFYEWDHNEHSQKTPYRFLMKSGDLFAMAGLWDSWVTEDRQTIYSCTILTTEANALVEPFHSRMPVILSKKDEEKWIDPSTEPGELLRMLKPFDSECMQCYEVTKDLNKASNNMPYLIKRL